MEQNYVTVILCIVTVQRVRRPLQKNIQTRLDLTVGLILILHRRRQ